MKTSRNPLSHYTNALGKAEMKSYLAGNSYVPGFVYSLPTLPEVTVYATRTGMSNEMHMYFKSMMMYSNSMNYAGKYGWSGSGTSAGAGLSGGGTGGYGTVNNQGQQSNFSDDFNKLLTALSLGTSTHGFTFDTIHAILNRGENLAILKQLGKYCSGLGIVFGITEVIDHYAANNGNLSINDKITLGLAITSLILLFVNPSTSVIIGYGLFGAGFDIYKAK